MNWDMVRDVVAAEDGMPVEIAVPVNGGTAPMVSSIPRSCSKGMSLSGGAPVNLNRGLP